MSDIVGVISSACSLLFSKSKEISKTVINSNKRFTYEAAYAILKNKKKSSYKKLLEEMKELCLIFKKKRFAQSLCRSWS